MTELSETQKKALATDFTLFALNCQRAGLWPKFDEKSKIGCSMALSAIQNILRQEGIEVNV